jgi:hypothetical protein
MWQKRKYLQGQSKQREKPVHIVGVAITPPLAIIKGE